MYATLSRCVFAIAVCSYLHFSTHAAAEDAKWISLFDGRSLDGWRASEHSDTWRVEDGFLVARGERSHLFYDGSVSSHDVWDVICE